MTKAISVPSEVGGYILAGGKSSRMGTDKALLKLAGEPLIRHAVEKLRRICMGVRILSSNSALAQFAPLIPDLHPDCGPIGGIEAALTHSLFDWNLFLPVDVPFLPTAFLDRWVRATVGSEEASGARIALFTVSGIPQPTLLMLHREAAPSIYQAVDRGELKLLPALEAAGRAIAAQHHLDFTRVFRNGGEQQGVQFRALPGNIRNQHWETITEAQQAAHPLWFANLNTPADFAEAEAHIDALDTLNELLPAPPKYEQNPSHRAS